MRRSKQRNLNTTTPIAAASVATIQEDNMTVKMRMCGCEHPVGAHNVGVGTCYAEGCACSRFRECEFCNCGHSEGLHRYSRDGICAVAKCPCRNFTQEKIYMDSETLRYTIKLKTDGLGRWVAEITSPTSQTTHTTPTEHWKGALALAHKYIEEGRK